MKTGRDVFERALRLLNYTDGNGRLDGRQYAEMFKRGLPLVNQIYAELWFCEHTEPFCELAALDGALRLSDRCVHDVVPYGVAMLLAQSESDGDGQRLFAALYDQKRAGLTAVTARADMLPRVGGGL